MKSRALWLVMTLLSPVLVGCVSQSTAAYDGAMTVTVENDTLTGSDNNYTNGLGVSWVSNDIQTYDDQSFVARWADKWSFLPFVGDEGYKTYAAWSIAQEMHTPDDIDDPNPPKDDEPYAGVLYVDSVLYAAKERWAHAWFMKTGIVGPASQADDVQKQFHQMIGSNEPMGWDKQLPNEPVLNVGYSVAHLLARGDLPTSAEFRIVPVATAGLGNYFTGVGAGMYGEIGWNLVDALGGTALRAGLNAASTAGVGPVNGWSVGLSGGISGYGVAHYLPLDGTVFHDSRSVDTEPFVGMATLGVCVRHKTLTLSLAGTFYTDMFETERERSEFGTFSVSWYF
jgi:lipid A 3-O-deacylase